jgi:hypothetical protein
MTRSGEDGRRNRAARRAGLEFLEKLLTTKLTSADTTERNVRMPLATPRLIASSGWASYWS